MPSLPRAESIAPWRQAAVVMLALAFLATGLGKLLDVPGFAAVLADYRIWPMALLLPLATVVTGAELIIGVAVLVPGWRRRAALAAALLAVGNAALLTLTLLRGIELENCGCFGVFLARKLTPWTPLEDIVLLGLAVIARGGRFPDCSPGRPDKRALAGTPKGRHHCARSRPGRPLAGSLPASDDSAAGGLPAPALRSPKKGRDMPDASREHLTILNHPKFAELIRARSGFAWRLSAIMLAIYFGFIALVAFAPGLLALKVGLGVTSLGLVLGLAVILAAFGLTGIYVTRANGEFDRLTQELNEELR